MHGVRVPLLVRELRSHMPWGAAKVVVVFFKYLVWFLSSSLDPDDTVDIQLKFHCNQA